MSDRQATVIQSRVCGGCFLRNEEQLSEIVANDNICAFKQKYKNLKLLSATMSLTASQYLKTYFDGIGGNINECELLILFSEMCQC